MKAAAHAYKVFYMRAPQPGGDADAYQVDHSTFTYLIGPDGTLPPLLPAHSVAGRDGGRSEDGRPLIVPMPCHAAERDPCLDGG